MVNFPLHILDRKYPFRENLVQKINGIYLNSNAPHSMVILSFSDQKYPFWEDLFQNSVSVCLR